MPTSKPLDIVVDPVLLELPEVQILVNDGHTVRAVNHTLVYDLMLGPRMGNLTVADIKSNPKLLYVAVEACKDKKYPKVVKPKKVKNGVDDKEAQVGAVEAKPAESAAPRKRVSRKAKPATNGTSVPEGAGGGGAADKASEPTGDTTGGGK